MCVQRIRGYQDVPRDFPGDSSRVEFFWKKYGFLDDEGPPETIREDTLLLEAWLAATDEGSADLPAVPGKVSNLTIFFGT